METKHSSQFGKGAIITDKLNLVHDSDVAMDSMPFDWNAGFDIRTLLGRDLTTKNQNTAYSCGGEATSYKCEAVYALNTKNYDTKSARFIYSQCFVTGGGSSDDGLIQILTNLGDANCLSLPDYPTGGLPDESFMENKSDITEAVRENATECLQGSPIYVNLDFDSLAKAIRDTGGIVIGVSGSDNGSWLSTYPQPPQDGGSWRHWLFLGIAKTINGKKYIGVKNSWGDTVGENGWQYLGEEYLPFIWRAFTFVNTGISKDFTHTFDTTQTYKLGANGDEIKAIQQCLKIDGEFPIGQVATGFFGPLTKQAVVNFQKKYASDILIPAGLQNPTGIVGIHTLSFLNKLFSS